MKIKNRVITGLFLGTLLAGSLYATNCDMDKRGDRKDCDKSSCMMKKEKFYKMQHNTEEHFFGIFKELNLTQEQKTKIEQIMVDSRKNVKSADEAFTKDSFDKAKYLQIMNEKRDNMLKSQAEVMEKSYAILTAKQKEQLRVLMDLKKEKMNQRIEEKTKG